MREGSILGVTRRLTADVAPLRVYLFISDRARLPTAAFSPSTPVIVYVEPLRLV